jgi:hypothetical protein
MATQVKSNAFGLWKAKDQENGRSFSLDVNPRYFCGTVF